MKLYASIDFYDEMCYAVWTPEMLDEYFKCMKSKGISRIYWIDQKEIMKRSGCFSHSERMRRTWENFNGDLTRRAAETAHKNDLEIFAVIKPYDLGIQQVATSDECREIPGIDVTGGRIHLYTDFARQHQESMLQRQVWPAPGQKAVKYIISFAEPLKNEAVFKIYASDRNEDYELVSEEKAAPGTVRIEVPTDKGRFMIFTIEGCDAANTFRKIVSAVDTQGREVPFSIAFIPNKLYHDTAYHLDAHAHNITSADDGGFRKRGMVFDYAPGIPSSIYPPEDVENEDIFNFAHARQNALGVTLELNPTVPGCPDPANQTFRDFIMEWVREDLDCGYDGIEIRISNHNSPVFWREYGSGREVRLARGKAHDSLLKEISQLVRSRGKKSGFHVPNLMFGSSPEKSTPMEFFWDYQSWIREKVCDEVTAKLIGTDGFSADSKALLDLCRSQGIPVNYCPFLHGLSDPASYAAEIAALGADAFNIYETATVWSGYEKGVFIEKDPGQAASLWQIPQI